MAKRAEDFSIKIMVDRSRGLVGKGERIRRMTAVLHMILLMLGIALGMPTAAHADEVPYVTTPTDVVDAMLSIAGVGDKDTLFDLGSGDGRIVITAAKQFHARGVGIEYDGMLIAQSRESAAREGAWPAHRWR